MALTNNNSSNDDEITKWCVGWINFGTMSIAELQEYANGCDIKYDKTLNKKQLCNFIWTVVKQKIAANYKNEQEDDENKTDNYDENSIINK